MKLLSNVIITKGIYKDCIGIVTSIDELGKIHVILPYKVNNKLQGYIRVPLEPQDIELR